jgi:hypothetical protein
MQYILVGQLNAFAHALVEPTVSEVVIRLPTTIVHKHRH